MVLGIRRPFVRRKLAKHTETVVPFPMRRGPSVKQGSTFKGRFLLQQGRPCLFQPHDLMPEGLGYLSEHPRTAYPVRIFLYLGILSKHHHDILCSLAGAVRPRNRNGMRPPGDPPAILRCRCASRRGNGWGAARWEGLPQDGRSVRDRLE